MRHVRLGLSLVFPIIAWPVIVGSAPPRDWRLLAQAPVVTEGRPEEWLGRVEAAMFATTKRHLFKVLEDSKGSYGCANRAGETVAHNRCWAVR